MTLIRVLNKPKILTKLKNYFKSKRHTNKLNNTIEDIDEKSEDLDTETQALDDKINSIHENYQNKSLQAQFSSSYDSSFEQIPAISHRNSTFMEEVTFTSPSDVKTFGQSVDFMQSSKFIYDSENDEENELDENSNIVKKMKRNKSTIGEDLLNEIELFRKTYIILFTHLGDCAGQLQQMYEKYVRQFLSAAKKVMAIDVDSPGFSTIDLMVSIACENTIVGCLFPKLWPCLLQHNATDDLSIQVKCDRVRRLLKINQVSNFTVKIVNLS